jgi:pyrroline-5-carboxylate reductase
MTNYLAHNVAVVGAGSLGRSLLTSYRRMYPALKYMAVIRQNSKLSEFINAEVTEYGQPFNAKQIMLCVKPYQAQEVCRTIKTNLRPDTVVVSAMAATPQHKLESWLETENVARIMPSILPNGPIAVYNPRGVGILLPTHNVVRTTNERVLDLTTATCGCVPGFMAAIMEQLINAVKQLGVSEDVAQALILCNLQALANENMGSMQDLRNLRNRVATKGGATEKGILSLEHDNVTNLFTKMFGAADNHVMALRDKFDKADN